MSEIEKMRTEQRDRAQVAIKDPVAPVFFAALGVGLASLFTDSMAVIFAVIVLSIFLGHGVIAVYERWAA